MIGALAAELRNKEIIKKAGSIWWIKLLVVVGIFFIIKRKESAVTYLIDGICSGLLLLVIEYSPRIQRLLNRRFFAKQGECTMAIFLVHVVVYFIVGKRMFVLLESLPYKFSFIITLLCCWIIIILISIPVTKMLNKIQRLFSKALNRTNINRSGKEMITNVSEGK